MPGALGPTSGLQPSPQQIRSVFLEATANRNPTPSSETRWLEPPASVRPESLADAVERGLFSKPKELPSRFFYDARGSLLFEEICELPEYYLTRAESEILEHCAPDLARRLPWIATLVELGSGSATKTELLLRAFEADRELRYAPIDVSRAALEDSVSRLEDRHPELEIWAAVAEYESGLAALGRHSLGPRLILWLGSSIGNLRRSAAARFLERRRETMSSEDRLLVGIDLRKDRDILERAYDDSRGITARFDLNLLARINRELEADFDLERFAHRVHYDEDLGSVQSFLESQERQTVRVAELDAEIVFEAGERIHTEDSYKYSFEEIDALARAADLQLEHRYLDDAELFSLNLFAPRPRT
jgi:dimethylhistidine N-methyltransferase